MMSRSEKKQSFIYVHNSVLLARVEIDDSFY